SARAAQRSRSRPRHDRRYASESRASYRWSSQRARPGARPPCARHALCRGSGRDTWSPTMRVLLVSGIFPPDIGGPATHAADLRRELLARGHSVELLAPTDEPSWSYDACVLRLPRRWPWPVRNALAMIWVAVRGRPSDVV